jgi:hypothetical protein
MYHHFNSLKKKLLAQSLKITKRNNDIVMDSLQSALLDIVLNWTKRLKLIV